MVSVCIAMLLVAAAAEEHKSALAVSSPVQKIVQLLEECKTKTQGDLDAESKAMEKYTQFCDDEANDKKYALDTASRQLEDLSAAVEDAQATIASRSEEVTDLGTEISGLNGDIYKAKEERTSEHQTFLEGEKALITTINQLGEAIVMVKKSMDAITAGASVSDAPVGESFLQVGATTRLGKVLKQDLKNIMTALSAVIDAESIDAGSKATLQSFLEQPTAMLQNGAGDDAAELALAQQMMKPWKKDKSAGKEAAAALKKAGIGGPKPPTLDETLERMEGQAEDRLGKIREQEMKNQQSFEMVAQRLNQQVALNTEKLATATEDKAATTQSLQDANAKSADVQASRAADEKLRATLATECQAKALEWEERMRSSNGEIAAIDKAKDILLSGVKVFVQVKINTRRVHKYSELEESSGESVLRQKLGDNLRDLAEKHHSFGLSQLAAAASSDPFVKVRSLIDSMIAKVIREAEEAATKEAFCQEEMGKGKKSQTDKSAAADKHKTRMDSAATQIAELTQAIQKLTAEIAEIDSSQAEATALRSEEHEDYNKASSDQKQSADATAKAIDVLKTYYSSVAGASLLQAKSKQPSFGGNQGGMQPAVIGMLEVCQDDFSKMLAETETAESEAVDAYEKLGEENRLSRGTKTAELGGKQSQVKSLKVQLSHSTEDYESVAKELDTVAGYLAKLEPECAGSVMSYAERKAAREAEISGLKDALSILDGEGIAFAQTGRRLRKSQ